MSLTDKKTSCFLFGILLVTVIILLFMQTQFKSSNAAAAQNPIVTSQVSPYTAVVLQSLPNSRILIINPDGHVWYIDVKVENYEPGKSIKLIEEYDLKQTDKKSGN